MKKIILFTISTLLFSACCKENKCNSWDYAEGVMHNADACGWVILTYSGANTTYKVYNLPAAYQTIEGLPVRFWYKSKGDVYVCDPDPGPPLYDQLPLTPIEVCDIEFKD